MLAAVVGLLAGVVGGGLSWVGASYFGSSFSLSSGGYVTLPVVNPGAGASESAGVKAIAEAVKTYEAAPMPQAQRDAIDRDNALSLFPQWA